MTQMESTIQRSALLNRLVLDQETTEEIGKVVQLWLDTETHQVVTVTCKSGFLGRTQRSFGWTQVETIGADSILVKLQAGVELETPDSAEAVVGSELWTDSGNKVGRLTDYCLDSQTGVVKTYLFTSDNLQGLTDGIYQLLPQAIVSIGPKRVIASSDAVQKAEQYTEGLGPKLAQAAEFLRDDYEQTQKDLKTALQEGKTLAEQMQDQAKKLTGQAKDQFVKVAGQVQETTQQLAGQVSSQAMEQWQELKQPGEHAINQGAKEQENKLDDSVFDFEESKPSAPPESKDAH